ncbi:hypothetical protein NEOLEDRAFT_1242855 [Neolentinus lepideus HHB14362 ss-1]|uniref:F-box domain-containing protein n=1 Tax=Neolentinus lepideus HHB14362 ss-1 TaxID=1314782 RepID=A0A165RJM0_9AGAM|nr:hypothetical protein NEOLEDRAFT_1242855 [Neolentinus lepideus HHB14362 ss-1]
MDKGALLTETEVSPFYKDAVVIEARNDIEKKISKHYTEIIGLKRNLNTLLPIARLPPELLAEIFLAYMSTNENSTFYPFSRYKYHRRFYIAQVCQHWRQVALEDPRLWANIDLSAGPRCVKEMLLRSKKAHLTISGNASSYRDSSESFELILAELSRVRCMDLIATRSFLQEFHTTGPRNVPCLRALKLSRSYQDPDDFMQPLPFISSLPLSNLEDLSVANYPLDSFRMSALPTLTSFSWTESDVEWTVSFLLALLRNMPLLRTLILSGSPLRSEDNTKEPIVNLPQLNYLSINCPSAPCAAILAHLSFPARATTAIFVDASTQLPTRRLITTLERIAAAMREMLESEPIRTFVVEVSTSAGSRVELKGWTTVLPRDGCRQELEPKFRLVVSTTYALEMMMEVVARKLPLSSVDYLQLDGVSKFRAWKRTFREMGDLTQLHVCGTAADGLPAALHFHSQKRKKAKKAKCADTDPFESDDDFDPQFRLFPRLEYIRLEAVQFSKVYEAPEDEAFIEQFERALKSRKYRRRKFQHVDILQAINFAEDEHIRLKDVVQECTWDGSVEIDPGHED